MSLLRQIVSIEDVIPQQSVKGIIRKPCYPLDRFQVDDITYRISMLQDNGSTFNFEAIKLEHKEPVTISVA
jgi:hypothetical protein